MRSEDETPPLDTLEAAKAAEPRPRSGLQLIPWFALLLVMVVGGPFVAYYITNANGERDAAIAQRDVYAKQADQLLEQVKALGAQPVVTPSPVPSSGPTAKSLTSDEVRAVVTDELTRYKLTITPAEINQIARVAATMVPKPKDGRSPTPAQVRPVVAAAVAAYCVGDKCVKQGPTGKPGNDGEPGRDAPKVTDAELLEAAQQALASYCANQPGGSCQGPAGPPGADSTLPGPQGEPGADAPMIIDVDCEGVPGLKFTFSFDRNHAPITAECTP